MDADSFLRGTNRCRIHDRPKDCEDSDANPAVVPTKQTSRQRLQHRSETLDPCCSKWGEFKFQVRNPPMCQERTQPTTNRKCKSFIFVFYLFIFYLFYLFYLFFIFFFHQGRGPGYENRGHVLWSGVSGLVHTNCRKLQAPFIRSPHLS